ncbi:MAG TPA: hypothetical protein VKN74_01010 [Candidatus Mcinerneyibacterium sp.]|nr:hypothetical protein [Candidatus Mcinerneyibacterium sp.]
MADKNENKQKDKWYVKIMSIKKPYVYLGMFLVVIIPFLANLQIKTYETELVGQVYNKIEKIHEYNINHPDKKKGVLIGFDYGPSTTPECDPIAYSVFRHLFLRDIPIVVWAPYGPYLELADSRLNRIAKEYKANYGKDYAFMGLAYPATAYMVSTSSDLRPVFNTDYYGNDVYDLKILDRFNNYDNFGLVVSISGTAMPEYWLRYANSLYDQEVSVGTTAVNAAKFYPYANSGQFTGMIAGLKGAAEYEQKVTRLEKEIVGKDVKSYLRNLYTEANREKFNKEYFNPNFNEGAIRTAMLRRHQAGRGMSSQFGAHIYVIILIIIGNIGYFFKRKAEKDRTKRRRGV